MDISALNSREAVKSIVKYSPMREGLEAVLVSTNANSGAAGKQQFVEPIGTATKLGAFANQK